MDPSTDIVCEPAPEAIEQPRDQYVHQVRDESRPAASVLHEQRADVDAVHTTRTFIP